jgi:hypothetical protein
MPLRRQSLPDCADAYSGYEAASQALSERFARHGSQRADKGKWLSLD